MMFKPMKAEAPQEEGNPRAWQDTRKLSHQKAIHGTESDALYAPSSSL